jgi:glycosyltransferase involved in cell wall biosynthesis
MRIVGITPEPMANSDYRVRFPLEALARRGHAVDVLQWDFYRGGDPPSPAALRGADVVHIWRLYEPPIQRFASALRQDGVAIVWDNDDDLLRRPADQKGVRVARAQTNDELTGMMKKADLVTTTCDELARRFRRASGADVRVIGNYVEAGFVRPPKAAGDELVIGWVAGGEHKADLKQLRLRNALDRVLQRHPHVRVVSVGLPLGLRSERYHAHQSVTLAELPSTIASFDIGLAPLVDISFNRVRSDVKLKEYAAAGVPWLASPIGPYRDMGEQQGGRVVQDPFWEQRLEELIADDLARQQLRERAVTWGRTQTIEDHSHLWESVFENAAGRVHPQKPRGEPQSNDGQPKGDRPVVEERRSRLRRLMRR